MGKLGIPVALALVDNHSQRLGHRVFNPLRSLITVRVVRARDNLADSQKLIYNLGKFRTEL